MLYRCFSNTMIGGPARVLQLIFKYIKSLYQYTSVLTKAFLKHTRDLTSKTDAWKGFTMLKGKLIYGIKKFMLNVLDHICLMFHSCFI